MSPQKSESTNPASKIYMRLLGYLRPYILAFLLGVFGFSLYALGQAGFAEWLSQVVDALTANEFEQRTWLALSVVLLFLIRGVGSFLGLYCIAYVARHVVNKLRISLFDQLIQLPMSYFQNHSSGDLLSRFTYNVEQVTEAVTIAVRTLLREGLTVVGLFAYLLYLNWKLTFIIILVMPLVGYITSLASKRFRKLSNNIQKSIGTVAHVASEVISGIDVVRIFGGRALEQKRFKKASEHNRRQVMKHVFMEALSIPLIQLIIALSLSLLIYIAMHPSIMVSMSAGEFVAFITTAGMIAKPIRQLTEINSIIQKGIAAATSIFEVIDQPTEIDEGQKIAAQVAGAVEFKNINFSYTTKAEQITLKDINFNVQAGESIALVGRSGSGKSTLASLLTRFNNPSSGTILLDGEAFSSYSLTSLRQQISIVNQQVVLFDGSIAENIAYGALADAKPEAIEAAARAAHVLDFTQSLPEGLDTIIGTSGISLSGGQRQRIAIARALLKNAPILILDEATSALDSESERFIQDAMQTLMQGRTTFIIAHRLSTIEHVDRILVLDKGEIIESGSHQQLQQQQGLYAQLHQLQHQSSASTD